MNDCRLCLVYRLTCSKSLGYSKLMCKQMLGNSVNKILIVLYGSETFSNLW